MWTFVAALSFLQTPQTCSHLTTDVSIFSGTRSWPPLEGLCPAGAAPWPTREMLVVWLDQAIQPTFKLVIQNILVTNSTYMEESNGKEGRYEYEKGGERKKNPMKNKNKTKNTESSHHTECSEYTTIPLCEEYSSHKAFIICFHRDAGLWRLQQLERQIRARRSQHTWVHGSKQKKSFKKFPLAPIGSKSSHFLQWARAAL